MLVKPAARACAIEAATLAGSCVRPSAARTCGDVGGAPRQIGDARVDILVDQVAPIGPRREVAVVTTRRAERDVHVHAVLMVALADARRSVFMVALARRHRPQGYESCALATGVLC